jgi:hypothetical protein
MSHNNNFDDNSDTGRLPDVQNTRALPFGLFGKSPLIRAMIVAALDKSQQQIVDDTKEFARIALLSVGLWWANTTILFPQFTGMASDAFWMLKMLNPIFFVFAGLAGALAIAHAVWYGGLRWKARSASQNDADSHTTPPDTDSEPFTDSERGDNEW